MWFQYTLIYEEVVENSKIFQSVFLTEVVSVLMNHG